MALSGTVGRNTAVLPFIAVILVTAFLYHGLGTGHLFNEDYAVYLQQAWNVAHHRPMSDMGIVPTFDPSLPLSQQSPLTYPPLLPILYAIPVSIFGFDLDVFKALQLAILAGGLLLFCHVMPKWGFRTVEVLASVVIFGLSHEIRRAANSIGSDLPFIFFLILALWLTDEFVRSTGRRAAILGIASGIAILLALDVRTVGVALLPTLLCADFAARFRLRPMAGLPLAAAALLWLGQQLWVGAGAAYGVVLNYPFFTPIDNVRQFYWAFVAPWGGTAYAVTVSWALGAIVILALVGVADALVRRSTVAFFVVIYTAMLLVLPDFDAGIRYLVPDLLFAGAFAWRGAVAMMRLVGAPASVQYAFAMLGIAPMLAMFLVVPAPFPPGPLSIGVATPSARGVFAFLRTRLPADAIVATSKYRSFHLFTGRRTIRTPLMRDRRALMAWLRQYRVGYIVLKHAPPASRYDFTDCPANPLCDEPARDANVSEVFSNEDFAVLKLSAATAP